MKKASCVIMLTLLVTSIVTLAFDVQSVLAYPDTEPEQTTTGWYWPAGSDYTGGYYGFLQWNPDFEKWHLAQDFKREQGLSVYSIGYGDIILSRTDVGGYGPGGGPGGALVVRYRTSSGEYFLALYGHLDNPHAEGSTKGGEILGYTNNYDPPHLHFAIHPGHDLPSNPWRGYTEDINNPYGWVDPIDWITTEISPTRTGVEEGVTENHVPPGCAFMNFEDGTDESKIRSTIPGLKFTTTLGYDWVYGDIRTGKYNVYPYGDQGYECNGNFFAWLGPNMGQGRIDFVLGPASYFSVLTSTYSGITIDAYDSNDNLIASSGWATNNLYTRTLTRVSIQKPGMAYVIVHDTGNYWLIDDIVTDAPTLGSDVSSESVMKIPHRIEISLTDGDWTTPNSKIGVYIYDISMRIASLIAELTPQITDDLVVSFTVVLKDRDGDGTVTADEIRENIQEQIPELMAKEYIKFLNEQINSLGLPPPPLDYGANLLNEIFDFARSVYNVASTYAPYALAAVVIPATIATAAPLTTYGVGGFQSVTGIYVPTHGLIGTDGEKMATMYSLGDLEIVDSEGRTVCKAFSQIPGASYIEEDLNDDGLPDDTIVLPADVRMDYVIRIIPDETAQPTDTFTLSLGSLGICFSLVSELSFSEIPEDGYGLHSTSSPRDNTPPEISIEVPSLGDALQDGVTFEATVSDPSEVDWVTFSIRESDGTVIDPTYESMSASHVGDDTWSLSFDTTQLPDGYYQFIVDASDTLGNEGSTTVDFSIRNWACVELLPATTSNKAGRTMPVKFSLRIVKAVDPEQPFVWNEELAIKIYEKDNPEEILQESTYGDTARDYRINSENELYITNFRTLRKKPTTYVVEIYRKDMLISSFTFETVK